MNPSPRSKKHALRLASPSPSKGNVPLLGEELLSPKSNFGSLKPIKTHENVFYAPTSTVKGASQNNGSNICLVPRVPTKRNGVHRPTSAPGFDSLPSKPRSIQIFESVLRSPKKQSENRTESPILNLVPPAEESCVPNNSYHLPESSNSIEKQEIYHKKMKNKYNQMRSFRMRISELEIQVDRMTKKCEAYDKLEEKTAELKKMINATGYRELRIQGKSQRDRIQELERYLSHAKEEIKCMSERLSSTQENDEALIDDLNERLQEEIAANVTISKKFAEVDTALKLEVERFARLQRSYQEEISEKRVLIDQLELQAQSSIAEERKKKIKSHVRNTIMFMKKDSLQTKLEQLMMRLDTVEHQYQIASHQNGILAREKKAAQSQLEAIFNRNSVWRDDAENSAQLSTVSKQQVGQTRSISELLECGDTIYRGAKNIESRYVMFHVIEENSSKKPYALHFMVYEGERAQEDLLTFYQSDIERVVTHVEPFLSPLPGFEASLKLKLVDILFDCITVSFKNGQILLSEKSQAEMTPYDSFETKKNLYQGSLNITEKVVLEHIIEHRNVRLAPQSPELLSRESRTKTDIVMVAVNEHSREGLSQSWWIEIVLYHQEYEEEYSCRIDSRTIAILSPNFAGHRPSEELKIEQIESDKTTRNMSLIKLFLDPILHHIQLESTIVQTSIQVDGSSSPEIQETIHRELVCHGERSKKDGSPIHNEKKTLPFAQESTYSKPLETPGAVVHSSCSPEPEHKPFSARSLKLFRGEMYSISMREIWDKVRGYGIELVLFDPESEKEMEFFLREDILQMLFNKLHFVGEIPETLVSYTKNLHKGVQGAPANHKKLKGLLDKRIELFSTVSPTVCADEEEETNAPNVLPIITLRDMPKFCLTSNFRLSDAKSVTWTGCFAPFSVESLILYGNSRWRTIQLVGSLEEMVILQALEFLLEERDGVECFPVVKRMKEARRIQLCKNESRMGLIEWVELEALRLHCITCYLIPSRKSHLLETHVLLMPHTVPVREVLSLWTPYGTPRKIPDLKPISFGVVLKTSEKRYIVKIRQGLASSVHIKFFNVRSGEKIQKEFKGASLSVRALRLKRNVDPQDIVRWKKFVQDIELE